ncbi:GroES-like protein [Coniochaeta ligniaria NRRL 30616]|uniref:GroES-like protein n=1 Tax=Coniochaeta ligniaria NRRL 30616 TaxID=1408157 RepID=A0A1J7IYN4_9PEZI|nr:GroES-like protein [Coniochaeta ligniaria NRRL 30616]
MASTPFKAIYLTEDGDITVREIAEPYQPQGSQALVKVQHSGINPGDYRHYFMGMHSFVMGYDFVGEVLEVGPDSPFKPGELLMGETTPDHKRPIHRGAHQAYLLAEPYLTFRRPADLAPLSAVSLVSAAQTASDALFNVLGFALPAAGLDGDDPAGQAILIWGGASGCGWAALQLARAAGFGTIIVTASMKNHAALKEAGATHCFDYHDDTVVADIRSAVAKEGVRLTAAFDAVSIGLGIFEPLTEADKASIDANYGKSTPALAKSCLSEPLDGEKIRLASTLPVLKDPDWVFALYSRKHYPQDEVDHPGWWQRQEKTLTWLIENHKTAWRPLPNTRVVQDTEEVVKAIKDVFQGKVSMEKVAIRHPMH